MENVAILGLCVLLSYVEVLPFQRLYYHPLSKFPGPALWTISRLSVAYHNVKGVYHVNLQGLHAKYGHVVRVATTELSYIHCEGALNDIHRADKITRRQLSRERKIDSCFGR